MMLILRTIPIVPMTVRNIQAKTRSLFNGLTSSNTSSRKRLQRCSVHGEHREHHQQRGRSSLLRLHHRAAPQCGPRSGRHHLGCVTTPIHTRQRCKGPFGPFAADTRQATCMPSTQRHGLVAEQVDDAGSRADALEPRHPRHEPAGRADGVARSEKGRRRPFGTKEITSRGGQRGTGALDSAHKGGL